MALRYTSITVAGWIEQVTYNDFVGWLFEDLFLCVANRHSLHPLLWNGANDKRYVEQCLYKKHRILIFQVLLHVTMFNKYCRLTWFIMHKTCDRHKTCESSSYDKWSKFEAWSIEISKMFSYHSRLTDSFTAHSSYGIQNASVSAENSWTWLCPSLYDVTQTCPSISALLCHSINRWGSLNQLLLVLLLPCSQVSL